MRAREIVSTLPLAAGETAFAVEYLPGQYDQRADSAVQCLQLLFPGRRPEVAAARVLVLCGGLAASDLQRIKRYCINPVDSREAGMAKPRRLGLRAARPAAVPTLRGFISRPLAELDRLGGELGLAMDAADLVWVVQRVGGYAHRFKRDCSWDATFEVQDGAGMYTYSDMTGYQLRTVIY